ncbi:MAG TPA: nuclear transport factor 2 family protein [Caulobacteraceae bacterium]|nr:nuclear transport factor 2 family protein [Caulobacteraceae bacterium]
MQPDFDAFFARYAEAYNRSLDGEVQDEAIRAAFADCFISAGPEGSMCGKNDDSFSATLEEAYAFYRKIGTKRMSVRRVHVTPIDEAHHLARVYWSADYVKKDGQPLTIDFDVSYLTQTHGGRTRIFAFVAGDELGLYRRHGLV